MNPLQEMVFLSEIVLQAKIAKLAARRLKDADHIEVWSSIQSILVASGNVSKILWPSKNENKDRGLELRKMLNLDDSNILSNRKFRNHFEHYDERIEDWFNRQSSSVYTDLAMNPDLPGSMGLSFRQYYHRGYNSLNNTLVFRGQELDLNKLLDELQDILDKCSPYVL